MDVLAALDVTGSAIETAGLGFQLYRSIIDHAEAIPRMADLEKAIVGTSVTIKELGELFKDTQVRALLCQEAVDAAIDAVCACKGIFSKLDVAIDRSKPNTVGSSWPFWQVNVDVLNVELDRLNITVLDVELDKLKITLLLLTELLKCALLVKQGKDIEDRPRKIEDLVHEEREAVARYEACLSRVNGDHQNLKNSLTARGISLFASGSLQNQSSTADALNQAEAHINNLLQVVARAKQSFTGSRDNNLPLYQKTMLKITYSNARTELDRLIIDVLAEPAAASSETRTAALVLLRRFTNVSMEIESRNWHWNR
ncbi:uncharacterized protein IWZ02DRAFT_463345 [Phyllosticta citriasiana]|uniref:uncharacterized protein n=1 Tax=Phyllosticta citriasiana TaxID=595635 RepID=UPI0030FDE48B